MEFPEELLYTEDHEWAVIDGEVATVGVTDYAQRLHGAIEEVELPAVGAELEAGRAFIVVHGAHAVADVYAPVSGEVVEVNEALEEDPDLINLSPYEDGWLVKVRLTHPDEVDLLMEMDDYVELVADLEE